MKFRMKYKKNNLNNRMKKRAIFLSANLIISAFLKGKFPYFCLLHRGSIEDNKG